MIFRIFAAWFSQGDPCEPWAGWTSEIAMTGSATATLTNDGNAIATGTSITANISTMKSGTLTFTATCKNYAGSTNAGTYTCTLDNVRIAKNAANTIDVEMQWKQ